MKATKRQRAYERTPARRRAHAERERQRRARLREVVTVIDECPNPSSVKEPT